MARLLFFNPWNDLALGSDSRYYTPPPMARRLATSGQSLMMWIGGADDYVLAPEADTHWWKSVADRHDVARPWEKEEIAECVPWGWSKAAAEEFMRVGIPRTVLPDDSMLDKWRMLSHRRQTIDAHCFLKSGIPPLEASDENACREALRRYGHVIGKYPWSSTGRGLFSGDREHADSFLRRCRGAIAHQKSVMIEQERKVVLDFALLYYSHGDGKTDFRYYSLFTNNKRAYTGNLVAPQQELRKRILQYIPAETLDNACRRLNEFLGRHYTSYKGWIGVDMFVYNDNDDTLRLNPCVEINMRHTMGVVASEVYVRHLPEGFIGRLTIATKAEKTPYLQLNPPGQPFRIAIFAD